MSSLSGIFDDVIDDVFTIAPVVVLNELAYELNKKTKGLLIAQIDRSVNSTQHLFFMDFRIIAPSLNNYSYEVLRVIHDLGFYPLTIISLEGDFPETLANNQEEFEQDLKVIISSPNIKKVINGLLAQVKQIKEDYDVIAF